MNCTFIVLIIKNDKAINFNNDRPISLCNFIYKIVSTILGSRICRILKWIISLNQGAFIKGHWIIENTILAQEILHMIKRHKKKNDLMLINLDMKKTYDKVECSCLRKVLEGDSI